MYDRNTSKNSVRQKRTRFATPAAPSEERVKQTHEAPIAAARDHVNSHAGTLHDKLEKNVVRCTADFMTRRQNLHYKIGSEQKLKFDAKYKYPSQLRSNWICLLRKGKSRVRLSNPSKRSTRKYSLIVSYI